MSALNVSCKETKLEGVECVYENHIGLMYSFDRTDRSVFNVSKFQIFETLKERLLKDRNIMAVYGCREVTIEKEAVIINGVSYYIDTKKVYTKPYTTYYGGEKLPLDIMEKICKEKDISDAYLKILKAQNAKNVVFFKETGRYFKLEKNDVVIA